MIYKYFRKRYIKFWKEVFKDDKKRHEKCLAHYKENGYLEQLDIKEGNYLNDSNKFHNFVFYSKKNNENKDMLIVDIHGGGWAGGSYITNSAFNIELAIRGATVLSPNYTLLDGDKHYIKDAIKEIFKFLHYIENNELLNGFSLSNVLLTGDSAGGQLSWLVYIINQNEEYQKIFDVKATKFKFTYLVPTHAVNFLYKTHKVTSFHFLTFKFIAIYLKKYLYGKKYKKDKTYVYSDPKKYIKYIKEMPKIVILSSLGDESFAYQSELMHELLVKENIEHTYLYINNKNLPHAFNVVKPYLDESIKFDEYLISLF